MRVVVATIGGLLLVGGGLYGLQWGIDMSRSHGVMVGAPLTIASMLSACAGLYLFHWGYAKRP